MFLFSAETWKTVPSVPVLEVSSFGRIRLVPYTGRMPYGGTRLYGGNPTFGYGKDRFTFRFPQVGGKTYRVARLVCETFNGPAPKDKPYCLHKDENARNNKPDNLVWGTQKENLNYPGFLAYCRSRIGENSPTIKGRKVAV